MVNDNNISVSKFIILAILLMILSGSQVQAQCEVKGYISSIELDAVNDTIEVYLKSSNGGTQLYKGVLHEPGLATGGDSSYYSVITAVRASGVKVHMVGDAALCPSGNGVQEIGTIISIR